jgi:hypothetical protein
MYGLHSESDIHTIVSMKDIEAYGIPFYTMPITPPPDALSPMRSVLSFISLDRGSFRDGYAGLALTGLHEMEKTGKVSELFNVLRKNIDGHEPFCRMEFPFEGVDSMRCAGCVLLYATTPWVRQSKKTGEFKHLTIVIDALRAAIYGSAHPLTVEMIRNVSLYAYMNRETMHYCAKAEKMI